MKKLIKRSAIVLFYIGLFAFPVYKAFIETQVQIDSFFSFYKSSLKFILYLVGWWFIYIPICWIIASFLFMKGNDAKDIREGCGYPSLAVISVVVCIVLYNKCHHDTNNTTKTNSFYNSEKHRLAPTKKSIKDDEDIDNRVYICTGLQSKRYHRSPYCRGLNSCSDEIEAVDVETAEDYDRTPCGICY